ncbi:MAG: hypothetical protein FWG93_00960 [Oscillospiraceae bacterium]|nr:hypothetical protein [Oscillospiraceae bacterium]
MIRNYGDFIAALREAGFSGAVGGRDDGVFALFRYGWGAEEETGIVWHTGDPDTDPWEWRMRVLDERDDIAYAKLFFQKAGYLTREWYPYFLAARRGGRSFYDEYADGTVSHFAKRVYDAVAGWGSLPLEEIKHHAGFAREDKSKFGAALTELQMKLYLTISGRQAKISQTGREYGWSSTVFCTTESFWPPEVFARAAKIGAEEAVEALTERILTLNPNARENRVRRFITG